MIQFLKREVRCKSGAIPVAVRPAGRKQQIEYSLPVMLKLHTTAPPEAGREGVQQKGQARRPAGSVLTITELSGEKPEMQSLLQGDLSFLLLSLFESSFFKH